MPTVRQARDRFFRQEGLPADGGYDDAWFDAAFGPVHYRIRNFEMRRDALFRHDIHHALTGYATDWSGEVRINAWELGAGLGTQAWAWVIMLMGFFLGAVLAPGDTLRAFARGRRSRNLYAGPVPADVLDRDLDALRAELGVTGPVRPGAGDVLAFAGALLLATGTAAVLALPLAALVLHGSWVRMQQALERDAERGCQAGVCPFTSAAAA